MDNNILLKTYSRIYQNAFKLVSPLLPWKVPKTLNGENCLQDLVQELKQNNLKKPLIVTDEFLDSIKVYKPFTDKLQELGYEYYVYSKTVPNPTDQNVNECKEIYLNNNCDHLVAIGGGSSMDCAKGVCALIARPKKSLNDLKGVLKVRKKVPFLICVPTTAGTGSEVTVATVITNPEIKDKYAINDLVLTPKLAVLDPLLTKSLPPHLTSTTGMDTLTHAVEAFIGKSGTKFTDKNAIESVKLVFENLEKCYSDGNNLKARQNMLMASYYGGLAFTRAYVGTVHALAHSLGGYYNVPHGLANAILLPITLRAYGKSVYKKLSILSDILSLGGNTQEEKALKFIEEIENLNQKMNIPKKLDSKYNVDKNDLDKLVVHAFKEINPLYPVPRILSKKELKQILLDIL